MRMWPKCTLMTQAIEAEALQKSYFKKKKSIIFKWQCTFQVHDLCEFWTLIITAEIATPRVTQLLAYCSLGNCCLFFHKLSVIVHVWACWVCTGQLTQECNSASGKTPVFWSDLVLWGMGRKPLKGKAGKLFGKWEKIRWFTSISAYWWELFSAMEARGEALAMEEELFKQKLIWKKRLNPGHCSQVATVGRIDLRMTWFANEYQIITSGLLSSPVASWDHQAGFFVWLASALNRTNYSFSNNISMWFLCLEFSTESLWAWKSGFGSMCMLLLQENGILKKKLRK